MKFTKATKKKAHARVAFAGPPGSGKTFTALRVMRGLVGPSGRIAVIDSERGSASKYAHDPDNGPCPPDLFVFDALDLENFHPETYVKALELAAREGYDGVIVDSLSHAWSGKDGALEQVDKRAGNAGGKFGAWRDVTPMQQRLVDTLLRSPAHIIATMRTKIEWVLEADGGKQKPKKIGTKVEQREGIEYEFDVVGEIDGSQQLTISKTRCSILTGAIINMPGEDLGATLSQWLTDGAPAPVIPPQATQTGTGKLPPATATQKPAAAPSAQAAPPTSAAPPPPFDLAAIRGRISMAETRDEAIAIAAAAGIDAQPDEVKAQVRIAIRARANEIDAERSAPSATAPAATAPATTGAAPAPVSAHAESAPPAPPPPTADADDPSADPGFRAFCADIQSATGEDTAAWTVTDAIVAWDAAVHFAKDRPQLEELCLAWVASSMKRGGPVMLGLRTKINSDYKAARAALAEPAPRAAGAAA